MKDELITFETAKLAKEKGFDIEEPCVAFYTNPRSKMFGIDEHLRYYNIKNTPRKLYYIGESVALNYHNVLFAPTQSLLQKWLREVHNIHVWCIPHINSSMYYGVKCWLSNSNTVQIDAFKTYEEALEEGLQEALKLIKN